MPEWNDSLDGPGPSRRSASPTKPSPIKHNTQGPTVLAKPLTHALPPRPGKPTNSLASRLSGPVNPPRTEQRDFSSNPRPERGLTIRGAAAAGSRVNGGSQERSHPEPSSQLERSSHPDRLPLQNTQSDRPHERQLHERQSTYDRPPAHERPYDRGPGRRSPQRLQSSQGSHYDYDPRERRRSPYGRRSRSPPRRSPLPPGPRDRDRDRYERDREMDREPRDHRAYDREQPPRAESRRFNEWHDRRDDRRDRPEDRYRHRVGEGQSYRQASPSYQPRSPSRRSSHGRSPVRGRSPPSHERAIPPPKSEAEEGEIGEEEGEIRPPSPSKSPSVPPPPPPEDAPPPPAEAPPPPPTDVLPPTTTSATLNWTGLAAYGNAAPNRNLIEPPTRVSTPVGKEKLGGGQKLFRFPTAAEEKDKYDRFFKGTTTLAAYDMGSKLGEGTFGVVTKAVELACKKTVALKKLIEHNYRDGVSMTTVREIKILKTLPRHTNIVPLLDMVVHRKVPSDRSQRGDIFMVFPFMDHDLCGLLLNKDFRMSHSTAKLIFKQILEGLHHIHVNNIVHRDLKTANILVSKDGQAMIADFGLARTWGVEAMPKHSPHEYTNMVVTRWYRAPELLLGDNKYGPSVDMWSMGCILGEMYHREPIFAGHSEQDQPKKIFWRTGPPSQANWPGWDKLPGHAELPGHPWDKSPQGPSLLQCARQWQMDRVGADLMCQLLQLDPSRRATAAKALEHPWFSVNPLPAKLGDIPVVESSHEMTSRDRNMPAQPPPQQLQQQGRAPAWSQPVRPPPPVHHLHGRQMHPRPPPYRPPPPNSLPSAPAYPSPASGGMGRGFAPAPPFGLAGNRRGGGAPMRPHHGPGPGPGGPGGHGGHGGHGGPGGPPGGGFGGPPGGGFRLAGGIRPGHGPSFGGPRPPKRPGDEWGGRPDRQDKRARNSDALPY
ncbi:hypothetical protein CspeluHIS016_0301540 [Cutaneotrichosporon spelunceum]|uniref:Protein kinase domain-containing protein n=1 Tax=Cutaneotrichosporon spelunceum TaxID=1672016 RepID=A0AAD3TTI5_9TREE|nr:hypothetical protein CspeluHIS016_0301540 [Cutaneotrichosporon spelunceum]